MDADGKNAKQLTTAKNCYNGGPFLSPDGTKVIFRSDRKEKDRLQLYVIDADGKLASEWRKVKVAGHADEVLAALLALPKTT